MDDTVVQEILDLSASMVYGRREYVSTLESPASPDFRARLLLPSRLDECTRTSLGDDVGTTSGFSMIKGYANNAIVFLVEVLVS
jgi:hypothetical protein